MKTVSLKGTKNGYEFSIQATADFNEVCNSIRTLLRQIEREDVKGENLKFDLLTGNLLLSVANKNKIRAIFDQFDNFNINRFISDVTANSKINQILDHNKVNLSYDVIRNGQDKRMTGDVLFLGVVHEGGCLITDGNVFNMGTVNGIIHAGFPSSESAMIIGDISNAQQLRIGEQFDIVADRKLKNNSDSLVYINELHVLSYSHLKHLKEINPKFLNRIGGVNNG